MKSDGTMKISGTTSDRTAAPFADQRVELWAGEHRPRRIAATTTDAAGKFTIEYDPTALGAVTAEPAPRVALKIYRGATLVDIVKGIGEWRAGQEPKTDLHVEVGPSTGHRIVQGRVLHVDGTAVKGVTVNAYHLGFKSETLLGTQITHADGWYEIRYQRPDGAPDLFVRASIPESKVVLATSHVVYAALAKERIALTVSDSHYRAPSEYARINKVLAPLLGTTDLSSLNTEDVAVLVEKTDIDREQVGRYVVAKRIALNAKLNAEAVYGLLRQGAPGAVARHVSMPANTVQRLLARASDQNIVSLQVGKNAAAVSNEMKTALADQAITSTAPRTVGTLLATAGLDASMQRSFARTYVNRTGDVKQFWTALRADPEWPKATVDKVELSLQLGRLSVNHPPLVKVLLAKKITSARDTAKLTRADWLALIDSTVDNAKVGVPKGVAGATDAEKRANYAGILVRQTELAFPTATIAEAMRRKDPAKTKDLVTFFDQNPSFDLGSSRVSAALADPKTKLVGIADTAALGAELKSYQRVFKVAPETGKYTTMSSLMNAGLNSALSVQRIPRGTFVAKYATAMGGAANAKTVYGNAVAQTGAALTMLTNHGASFQGIQVKAVSNSTTVAAEGASRIPDYRTLFGSIDYCQCEHCRSVLSPAAYLVDLLNWLDTAAPTDAIASTPGAVDELFRRRPDIGTMELSCDNTNIPLPYVDLVNEVLENGVAVENGLGLVEHDTTSVPAAELLANPEHVNAPVYDVLAAAFYPFTLPFHLANMQARVFLRQVGVERWKLMEAFQRAGDPTDVQVATEYLELTTAQREHITGTAGNEQWRLWGYDAETGHPNPRGGSNLVGYRKALQFVPELLGRAGLAYKDLLDLLHTDFVNADDSLRITSTGDDVCNVDEMELERVDTTTTALETPTVEQLGHIRRFIRMSHALDYTMLELDKTLIALNGATDIADRTLRKIADIQRIQKLAKIDLLSLISWWSKIDVKEDRGSADPNVAPLYDRVFLNHAVIVDPDSWPFYLNADRADPASNYRRHRIDGTLETADPTRPVSEVAAELQAALGLSTDDLIAAEARVALDLGVATLTVNLDVLSRLHRIASLAKTVKLPVAEALAYVDLVAIDPFTGPHEARLFIEELQKIRATGFSINDLLYLLGHDAEAAVAVAPSEDTLAVTLGGLRAGLKKIGNETVAVESDATGEITRQHLTQIVPEANLEDVMAVIAGSYISELLDDGSPGPTAEEVASVYLAPFLVNPVARLVTDATEIAVLEARYAYVLAGLVPYLATLQSATLIKEQIASALGREVAAAEDLLVERIKINGLTALEVLSAATFVDGAEATIGSEATSGVDLDLNPTDQKDAFDALVLLHKVAAVLRRFDIDAEEQAWIFDHQDTIGILHLAGLPLDEVDAQGRYRKWKALAELIAARDRLPSEAPTLWELLDLLLEYGLATDPDAADDTSNSFLEHAAARTGWSADDLEYVIGALGYAAPSIPTDPHPLANGVALGRVLDCMEIVAKIGTGAEAVDSWRAADLSLDPLQPNATDIVMTVKSHYDVSRWPTVARPLRDQLRDVQRTALVAYLVDAKGFEDENDLFAEYLIDVEMSSCMLTSRLKQGISSVQLFIQRCFLNLEPPAGSAAVISLTAADDDRWQWMKTYRVWEANRKVFLYPENWIEPELRDDKTPFFRQLESELMQDEITDEKVESAYLRYLANLLEVTRLEIAGFYHQEDTDDDGLVTDVLHVFGRTRGNPHTYYYRRWEDGSMWTAWEKVEIDIEGDHLIPVVHDRRLILLWPIFTGGLDGGTAIWNVQLAWSEYWDGRWSPKKMSVGSIPTSSDDKADYFFKSLVNSDGDLVISLSDASQGLTQTTPVETAEARGQFRFGCDGTITASVSAYNTDLVAPLSLLVDGMTFRDFVHAGGDPLYLTTGKVDEHKNLEAGTEDTDLLVLDDTPTPPVITHPHQYNQFCSQGPFFFADDDRTFFVLPRESVTRISPKDFGVGETAVEDTGDYDDDGPGGYKNPPDPGPIYIPTDIKFYENDAAEVQGAMPDRATTRSRTSNTTDAKYMLASTQQQLAMFSAYDTGTFAWGRSQSKYLFQTFHHPYVCKLIEELRRGGLEGMLSPAETKEADSESQSLARQQLHRAYFKSVYHPIETVVLKPYPKDEFDFEYGTAYSQYNWELFFHAPLLLADRLRRNQRFEEALRWFHFIFDPMNQNQTWDAPARYWKIRPFLDEAGAQPRAIQDLLALLPASSTDPATVVIQQQLRAEIAAWLADPFDPHTIARLRTTAYQKTVVMKYLDNLIEWADCLFRQDTIETINQATQLYILALEILGDKPEEIPPRAAVENTSFNDLRALGLDELSNTLVEIETDLIAPADPVEDSDGTPVDSVAKALYFCVPLNEKLFRYWTTIEDRLFKIRHCMNIQGVVRQLALFEPPIDPAMLVRAAAAGIDLSSAIADLSAPRPHYRFTAMMQRAQAFCGTVRALGGALLSALEKRDAEELGSLRTGHEVSVLKATRDVRKQGLMEAREQQVALERTQDSVTARRDYYQTLIDDGVSDKEQEQIDKLTAAKRNQLIAGVIDSGASILHALPNIEGSIPPAIVTGGSFYGSSAQAIAHAFATAAGEQTNQASLAAIKASNERRAAEWGQQLDAADKELNQVAKQIAAAVIRVAMAETELANSELQIENAREADTFMRSKYTNRELYDWMVSQISSIYFQSYQLAYDLGSRAERCYQHELAAPDASFIQFGHWDSLKKGLLAGERLQFDLERCEASYLENDQREYEITKHISLASLDPVALVQLRENGTCAFAMPEAMFDLDFPGHYLRRIKSVAVTVPCVAGPYTGINCTLTLSKSSVRVDPTADDYARNMTEDDPRFRDELGVESIVTSVGQNDAGLFEPSLMDPRYLPFERRGAADSQWQLTLASAQPQFDRQSISDVVLHVRYTAREGGSALKAEVVETIGSQLAAMAMPSGGAGLMRLFSARHEMPDAWNAFLNPAAADTEHVLELDLADDRFPYPFQGQGLVISSFQFLLVVAPPSAAATVAVDVTAGEASIIPATLTQADRKLTISADWGDQPYLAFTPDAALLPGTFKLLANKANMTALGTDQVTNLLVIATYRLPAAP